MILYINKEYCLSVEQLKGFFTKSLDPDCDIYTELLDYGRHGDIVAWLREMNELELASKLESIPNDLEDHSFFAQLKAAVLGIEVTNAEKLKPAFDKCFSFEGIKCDLKDGEVKVSVCLKVLMAVNETYKINVNTFHEKVQRSINASMYEEGCVFPLDFVLHQPFDNITIRSEYGVLYENGPIVAVKKKAAELIAKTSDLISEKMSNYVDKAIVYLPDEEVYQNAKVKLDAVRKKIKEDPIHIYDAYDGVGTSDREKEEEIINKEIRPLADKGHKSASIDYYWYLFVRRYEDAEIFKNEYEKKHFGEKLIEVSLTDDQLYEKVKEMLSIIADKRSRALSRTAWTGTHSTDINDWYEKEEQYVFKKFIIPLAKKGCRPACLTYYRALLEKNPLEARVFLSDYREKHPGDELVEHANTETALRVLVHGLLGF